MKRKLLPTSLIMVFLLIESQQVFACCAGSTIGKAETAKTVIQNALNVMKRSVSSELDKLDENNIKGMDATRQQISKMVDASSQEQIAQQRLLKQQEKTLEIRKELEEDYGSAPESVCLEAANGAVSQVAAVKGASKAKRASVVAKKRTQGMDENGRKLTPGNAVYELATWNPGELDVSKLSDPKTDEQTRRKVLARMVDPNPPEPLDEAKAKQTAAGLVSVSLRRERELRMSAIREALKAVYELQAPPSSNEPSVLGTLEAATVVNGWPSSDFQADLQRMARTDAIRALVRQQALGNLIQYYLLKLETLETQMDSQYFGENLSKDYDVRISNAQMGRVAQ